MKNPHRALTDVLVGTGMSEEDAVDQVERVLNAIPVALRAGKAVRLPSVGDLRPKRKRVYVPGSCQRKAREECRAQLRAGIIEQGEPYDVAPPEKSSLTYLNPRALP